MYVPHPPKKLLYRANYTLFLQVTLNLLKWPWIKFMTHPNVTFR